MPGLRCLATFVLWIVLATAVSGQEVQGSSTLMARPDPPGVPTRVAITVFFLDLIEIDDVSQEYTADIFVRFEWRDGRLALDEETSKSVERMMPLSRIWWPQLASLNRRTGRATLPESVRVDATGNVTYDQRFYGTLAARLDLHDFPSDRQTLPLEILSYRYTTKELELEVRHLSRLDEMSLIGWHVEAVSSESEPPELAAAEQDLAGATFRIEAKREVSYYLWTMGLPLLLIAIMAWTVFWIDPSLLPSQLAISTASVFSLIAFRFSMKLSLPRVSYLTNADTFVLIVTVLVFGALGQAVMTGRLAKRGHEDLARTLDRWGRWIYMAVLVGLIFWLIR